MSEHRLMIGLLKLLIVWLGLVAACSVGFRAGRNTAAEELCRSRDFLTGAYEHNEDE